MSIARTILKNTLSNWVGMFILTIVTILITPYVLKHLGDERYGVYQIVFSVMHYVVLLEFGIKGSVARFSSKYIHARDLSSLNSVISTVFFFYFCIGTLMVLTGFFLGLLAVRFFGISDIYRRQVLLLFVGLGISTMISLLSYSFGSVLVGHNRFDLQNVGMLIANVGRAILVVILFSLGWVSLSSWSLAIVLASFLALFYTASMAFYLEKGLRIRLRYININTIKELGGFGLWNMIVQLAGLLTLSANPIIIGKFMGPEAVPYYAIPFMLVTRLQAFVRGLTSTLMPHASATLSTGDTKLLRQLLVKGTYTASMLVFPLGGILLVMCKTLFSVWLPVRYESSWVIYGILMIAFFGSITQTTSYYILLGGGDIRGMSLTYLAAGLTAVGLAVYFLGWLHFGIIGATVALVIPRFISTCVFQPWYASRQTGLRLWSYLARSYTMPILCALPSVALGGLLVYWLPPSNLFYWALEFFIALVPYVVFALTGILDWPMREKIVNQLRNVIGI